MIPALDISLPVVSIPHNDEGWDLTWLWQGAGWLEGTAYPTWTGNTVITGHAYLSSGLPGPFVNLEKLSWGDEIVLIANGYRYSYQVRNKSLVSGSDSSILGHEDQDWLTLFTCKDYSEELGDYRWRQVVQAVLIDVEPLE
jgi:LPXTG-site transpeptidase (sortase) family protein